MTSDRITEDRDWRDGISQFRTKIIEQIGDIIEVLDLLEKDIAKLKQKQGETP